MYFSILFQHANEDVEKMILGNKCDMEEKRAVSKERGEAVSYICIMIFCALRWPYKNYISVTYFLGRH